ncbi:hypothetical protein [Deinococcus soli (ex Cha et al. 2016)]|uniref:Uncharacterized protein n=2 Tax=Deinococcus soli (ex Cha et al. 2016) TaxID=1309411 RepID=A0ACC6KFV6_9DEIO|nr:hypothetical protein [Deinococcus soli (ex Cha et al. 2016)]MDR6218279.1 hypothetical protein [Deinococcus soli (ex Cha et al. 2016)]MDR6329019.1 hypothetical protein [Deinococcus soli (ex Cha et al. 2016)]MDR6751292.1 hypothetical protein [Deinococcus soli (ex Cha et al. 2016)]
MDAPILFTDQYPTRYVCAAAPGHLVVQTNPAFLHHGCEHAAYGEVRRDERTGLDASAAVHVLSGRPGTWRVHASGRAADRFRLAVTVSVEDLPSRQAAIDAAPAVTARLWAALRRAAELDDDARNLLALEEPARVTTRVPEDRRVRTGTLELRREANALHCWCAAQGTHGVLIDPDLPSAYALLRCVPGQDLTEACAAHLDLWLDGEARAFGQTVSRHPGGPWRLTAHATGHTRTLPGTCTPEQALLAAWTERGAVA